MPRRHFAKGYIFHDVNEHYIRVEESYDGKSIEVTVGDDNYDCGCRPCGDCDPCEHVDVFTVRLTREQIRELTFTLRQLHFIDDEKAK